MLLEALQISPLPRTRGWEWAKQHVADAPAFSAELRAECLRALGRFEQSLERAAPWEGWRCGHSLAAQFFARFDGCVPEGVRLHRLLAALDDDPLVDALVSRLGGAKWHDYLGALTELEIAARMKRAGLPVALVHAGGTRGPDFVVELDGRPLAVECTAATASMKASHADALIDALFNFREGRETWCCSVVVRFSEGANIDGAHARRAEIFAAVAEVGRTGCAVDLPGLGCVAPVNDVSRVVVVDGGLTTGSVIDEVDYICRKVERKIMRQQLRGETPAVLVVRASALLGFLTATGAVFAALAELLAEIISAGPEVGAVLLYSEWRASAVEGQVLHEPAFRGVVGQDEDGSNRMALLVPNPLAMFPLRDGELGRLAGPAMVW